MNQKKEERKAMGVPRVTRNIESKKQCRELECRRPK